MIKLIALDIDGTLLTSDRAVSEDTYRALRAAHSGGCMVVLATGRAFRSLLDVKELIGCVSYAITSSGSGVFDATGNMLFAAQMPQHLVRAVTEAVCALGVTPEVYIRGQAYASAYQLQNMHSWGVSREACDYVLKTRIAVEDFNQFVEQNIDAIEGMDVLTAPHSVRENLRTALDAIDGVVVTSSSKYYADINVSGITKASGLAHLGALLSIDSSEMMAFGDAENDLDMLRYVGVGVAMGNCLPALRQAADYITDTNDADGIAKALHRFGVI